MQAPEPQRERVGPLRVEMDNIIVFLLKEKFEIGFTYHFIPYFYGPYSRGLQFDMNLLEYIDTIQVESSDGGPYSYALTPKGLRLAQEIEENIDPRELQRLEKSIKLLKAMPTDDLIREAKREANMPVL